MQKEKRIRGLGGFTRVNTERSDYMPREHPDYRAYMELIHETVGKNILSIDDVMKVTGRSRNFVNRHIMVGVRMIGSCTLARKLCEGVKT